MQLLRYCSEGILLDDEGSTPNHSIGTAPVTMIQKELRARRQHPIEGEACREQLKEILLQERQFAQLTSVLKNVSFKDLKPEELLSDDMRRLILCVLHGDMRMGEKLLNLLFGKCAKEFAKSVAEARINETAVKLADYARLGKYFRVRFSVEDKKDGLDPIQLNGDKIRRVFDLPHLLGVHGQEGVDPDGDELLHWPAAADNPLFQVIDVLLGGSSNGAMEAYILSFKRLLVPYCRSQHIQHSPVEFDMCPVTHIRPKAVQYQNFADECFGMYVELFGEVGMTNYWHCYGSGHFYELMHLWGNLQRFRNEGAEALNLDLKMRFLKHTQRGGSKGRGAIGCRLQATRSEGLGKWLQRRYMWLTGLAWKLLGEEHMPQRMQDELRETAQREEILLELDPEPDASDDDDDTEVVWEEPLADLDGSGGASGNPAMFAA
jgi:hypothetical protein